MNNTQTEKNFTIDTITGNDLNLDEIISLLDCSKSSVGSEYVKAAVHTPLFQLEPLKKRSKKADFFKENETASKRLSKYFSALGRTKKVSFLDYIFKLKEVPQKGNVKHIILILLLLLAIVLIFVQPAIGIIAFVVMIAINIILYFKEKAGIEGYFICLKYLVSMVVCAQGILSSGILKNELFAEELQNLEASVKTFAGLKRGSWLITNSVSGSLVDVIMDYVRMIFHVDLMKFNSMRDTAIQHEEQINVLYNTLGELELCMCVAAFRSRLSYYCEPVFFNSDKEVAGTGDNPHTLIATEVYHPLIKDPVVNTMQTKRSVLLTGSNASGKSTFLKTIAINQILAQTIYTCLAKQFLTTYYKVLSSMALTDNILGQESYFIVEIKSLKRIYEELGEVPVMCFIDEVLRGTNTVERIAASSRILEHLSQKNALIFAATHDIELTVLLSQNMENYHFSETVEGDRVAFDYKLKEGPANSSNAIKLLDSFGFDKEVVEASAKRAEDFLQSGTWS